MCIPAPALTVRFNTTCSGCTFFSPAGVIPSISSSCLFFSILFSRRPLDHPPFINHRQSVNLPSISHHRPRIPPPSTFFWRNKANITVRKLLVISESHCFVSVRACGRQIDSPVGHAESAVASCAASFECMLRAFVGQMCLPCLTFLWRGGWSRPSRALCVWSETLDHGRLIFEATSSRERKSSSRIYFALDFCLFTSTSPRVEEATLSSIDCMNDPGLHPSFR